MQVRHGEWGSGIDLAQRPADGVRRAAVLTGQRRFANPLCDMHAIAIFYGRLRECADAERRSIALTAPVELGAFRALLTANDPDLRDALSAPTVRIAVNDVLSPRGAEIIVRPGDEIAFMPPFSGG